MALTSLSVPPQSASAVVSIFKLFLLPVGGGIPAGVLLAKTKGVAWPLTSLLYLVSDLVLAVAFEPLLKLMVALGGIIPLVRKFALALKATTARSVAHFGGTTTGPLGLVMVAFGVDPMTGRASALAAGHGFVTGWAIAIAGDMLYFGVIAVTTLRLNSYIRDPNITMIIVLAAMFFVPVLVRRFRGGQQAAQ
ncbi:hypothetical protein GMSM_13930 [Geomonas sp. Red276]